MCKNCSNCKCKQTKEEWIAEYQDLPEAKKSATLSPSGVYDMMQARKERDFEKEARSQWRRS